MSRGLQKYPNDKIFYPPAIPADQQKQISNLQCSTESFGTYSTISSSTHKQLSKQLLSYKNSQSCSFSMHNIREFIILPQKLIFRPNSLSRSHSNCSISPNILMPLAKKNLHR